MATAANSMATAEKLKRMKPKLIIALMARSVANTLEEAVKEWRSIGSYIVDHEMGDGDGTCVCGQEHIVHQFTIVNAVNGEYLSPIGSVCIHHFAGEALLHELKVYQHKDFVFNNRGGKNHGKTFDWICQNDRGYVEFLLSTRIKRQRYKKLMEYYVTVHGPKGPVHGPKGPKGFQHREPFIN